MMYILLMSTILQVYISTNGVQSQGTTIVSLQTSTKVFRQPFELRCTYSGSSCCTLARIWNRDGVAIMTNGNPISTRYQEVVNGNAKYFSLIITSLEESDLGKAYSCQYDFATSALFSPTLDSSYIYIPQVSCENFKETVNGLQKKLTGSLNITKAAPSPKLTATYGGTNWTADLSITTVNYGTWFYYVIVSIDKPTTCGDDITDEKFTLAIQTGTINTKICDEENLCNSERCGLRNWGYCEITLAAFSIVVICIVLYRFKDKVTRLHIWEQWLDKINERGCCCKMLMNLLLFGLVIGIVLFVFLIITLPVIIALSLAVGFTVVNCLNDTDPVFTVFGLIVGIAVVIILVVFYCRKVPVSCLWCLCCFKIAVCEMCNVIVLYNAVQAGKKGSRKVFKCPNKRKTTRWQRVVAGKVLQISDGSNITDPLLRDRVSIVGDHEEGEFNLQLSGLQESDEVFYICNVGWQKQFLRLEVLDEKDDHDHPALIELYSLSGQNAPSNGEDHNNDHAGSALNASSRAGEKHK